MAESNRPSPLAGHPAYLSLRHSSDAPKQIREDTRFKNERDALENRKGCEMHGMELRLTQLRAKQEALLLEAERNRLLKLAHGPRPAWTLSSLLYRKPKLKIAKA
jgi:hypothetical protein